MIIFIIVYLFIFFADQCLLFPVYLLGLLDHARQFLQSFYNLAQTHKGMNTVYYNKNTFY